MYTRCPACEALYELSPEELAEAAGVVRCSNCGKTFNSLAQLFATQPEPETSPLHGKGMPPLLANRVLLQPSLPGFDSATLDAPATATASAELDEADAELLPGPRPRPLLWPAIAALLALLAVGQALWLLDLPERWLEGESSAAVPVDPATAISLIGRDMHPHPSRDDVVVINALLRNQSNRRVDFPLIELRLFDRSNQLLGVRRLEPAEYLPDPGRVPSGLEAGMSLPLIVELVLAGSEPTGFELRFF